MAIFFGRIAIGRDAFWTNRNQIIPEPIRLLFAYTGVDFEDNRIDQMIGSPEYLEFKKTLPWGVMPCLEIQEDGKTQLLCQSGTILRYLARRYKLAGDNEFEMARCEELFDFSVDLKNATAPLWTPGAVNEEQKVALEKKLVEETYPKFLQKLSQVLEENGNGFLVGNRLSFADIGVAHYTWILESFYKENGYEKEFPKVAEHIKLVMESQGIKEWIGKRPKTPY